MRYDRLPEPDAFGSYWWGAGRTPPAVFRVANPASPDFGRWFACPGGDAPVPFDPLTRRIRAFDTPEEAARSLGELTRRKTLH